MKRASILVLFAALALATMAPSAAAGTTPRIPTSAADWATFSATEQQAALTYEFNRFKASLANGTARIDRHMGNDLATGFTATATGYASCGFQQSVTGPSRYVAGGGSTTASALMDLIYASKSTKQGQFLRDGALKGNWYRSVTDASYVEAWTGFDHSRTWEHPTYRSNGWHGALDGSTWVVGPEQPCSYSYTP